MNIDLTGISYREASELLQKLKAIVNDMNWDLETLPSQPSIRPPLGLMPLSLWNEERAENLKAAMLRYLLARKPIPIEWLNEYQSLNPHFK